MHYTLNMYKHYRVFNSLSFVNRTQSSWLSVSRCILFSRGSVLRWAGNHDHQVWRGVPISDGSFRAHPCFPVFLDLRCSFKAVLLCHHLSQFRWVFSSTFLSRLLSAYDYHQVLGCSFYLWVIRSNCCRKAGSFTIIKTQEDNSSMICFVLKGCS